MATKYLRPGVVQRVLNTSARLFSPLPVLAVRGRTSDQWRTTPIVVLQHNGGRYLVSPRGTTDWVRNLRAAGGGELRRRAQVEPFQIAEEVPVNQRAPLIAAYQAATPAFLQSHWKQLPDPADHPIFEITSA